MDWRFLHNTLFISQHVVSAAGVIIILIGVLLSLKQYASLLISGKLIANGAEINVIRLNLGRTLILGLEFIVAADLIGTTTTPDYYAVGLLAIIVLVRTVLSFSLNRELQSLSKDE